MPLPGAVPVVLSAGERKTLSRRVRGAKTAYRDRLRAQIVLAAARGLDNARIAADLAISVDTVRKLNPHEAVPGGWPPLQLRSRAFLAWAVASARQLAWAEPATTSPAIRGARDAQLATPAGSRPAAEPARAYLACGVSGSMEPTGWAAQIEPIRHGAPHSGLRREARSCR
jgi:hypothetical protein